MSVVEHETSSIAKATRPAIGSFLCVLRVRAMSKCPLGCCAAGPLGRWGEGGGGREGVQSPREATSFTTTLAPDKH